MRNKFEQQLLDLNNSLIEMGGEVEYAITTAVEALLKQDVELAKTIINFEEEINEKEREIENLCMKLLLQQQPVAKDLRLISAAMKMITDLERIGVQSADISEIAIILADKHYIKELVHIPQMGAAAVKMINEALDAFVKKDLELAYAVIRQDDIVDDLFLTIKSDLIALIRQDIDHCEQAFDLMMIAKYFERIGDHAVNIAQWVVFSLTGERIHDKLE